ncbi:hypothetical protein PR202_ga09260 [Eleusine coracana subsp. coracana]|uniref:L-ascorbate oxidase n=1 Tax=Eleusine coracana subsp. coracana TaxID=191504 RepID=A0AAV5C3T0_ELECO|nr:hypothetical protein PR202_ga09260 [Eleusine coracana subsp. coracana]
MVRPATMTRGAAAAALVALALVAVARAEDPYHFFEWKVTYGTKTIMGTPQKVILINDMFPGPTINCTSNNNIVVNVFNMLDQPLLFTWHGIQQRKNSWQDGMPGTMCPIAPGTNFTYHWQAKDQIGSFFYFPSIGMQRSAGGYGLISVHSRDLIPVPFDTPADDFPVLVGDWYTKDHTVLAKHLDAGKSIGRPAGLIINGKNEKDASNPPMYNVEAGKTYRFRNTYDSLDVHVGQCLSFLVTADQKPADYFLVVSTRFIKEARRMVTAVIRYKGSSTPPSPKLPEGPSGWAWSINQWRSFRWNLTASAARPNPQGSYHYGQINITRTIKLSTSRGKVGGKDRYAINGVSHVDAETPLQARRMAPNVLTAEFRTFIEVVFENPEKSIDTFHIDGYAFFAAGMGPGTWSPQSRKTYNLLDTVSRHTIQVYPRSWTAVMLTFDNAGMWNIRSNLWERHYLGQQMYISVVSPARSLRDEYNMPESSLRCGKVVGLPMPPSYLPA